MKRLLLTLLTAGIAFSISEEEFRKDKKFLDRLEKRLEVLDGRVKKEGVSVQIIDELNSYGYPLHVLEGKYMREEEERFEKFYRRVKKTYQKVLYVKRGIFPELLKKEIESLNVPVCDVTAEGKRRETVKIVLKDPENEENILKIMTQTQLQHAHLLGIEEVKFGKCKQ